MSDELKPCPFCGGEAIFYVRMDENIWDHSQVRWESISCNNMECDAQGFDWPVEARPNARDRWNTRTDAITPQQAAEVLLNNEEVFADLFLQPAHSQIDWCRNDQNTYLMRHESQTEPAGTSCAEDLQDALTAWLKSLSQPQEKE